MSIVSLELEANYTGEIWPSHPEYDFSTVLAWPEVAAVETAAAEAAVAAVGWACTFVLAEVAVAAESPKVTALRIIRRALRQRGAGRLRRRRCTRQEPCWARGWPTLARLPPSRPSGRCRIKVGRINLLNFTRADARRDGMFGDCDLE